MTGQIFKRWIDAWYVSEEGPSSIFKIEATQEKMFIVFNLQAVLHKGFIWAFGKPHKFLKQNSLFSNVPTWNISIISKSWDSKSLFCFQKVNAFVQFDEYFSKIEKKKTFLRKHREWEDDGNVINISSVIKQKGESRNGGSKKTKYTKRTCAYQGVINNRFFWKFGVLCFIVTSYFEIRVFDLLPRKCDFLISFQPFSTKGHPSRH